MFITEKTGLGGSEIVLLDLLTSALNNHASPILWCNNQVLAEKSQDLGVEVILDKFVCLGYWTEPRWNFKQYFKLILKAKQIIKVHNVNLVHCNNGGPCQWMVPVCKLSHTPLLLHLHAKYRYRDRLTLFFHRVDAIIGVSNSVIQLFKKNEFHHQQVNVVYNGIAPQPALSLFPRDMRAELSANNDDFVILYMGSLIKRKLVHNLVNAIKVLKKRYKIKLAIIGSGPEQDKLKALTTTLQITKEIKFFPQNYQVAKIYSSNVDCFISVPEEEVFGLTLAEASLAMLPIITSNIPGINEIYTHQKSALLVSLGNIDELISTVEILISSPKNRHEMAKRAYKNIITNFSLEQQSIAFNLAYKQILVRKESKSIAKTVWTLILNILKAFLYKFYKYLIIKFSSKKT